MRILILLLIVSSVCCHFGDNSADMQTVGFQFLRKFFDAGNDYGADDYDAASDKKSHFLNRIITASSKNS